MVSQKNNRTPKQKIIFFFAITALIIVGLSGYWLKSWIGVSFFEGQTLSKYFPFNYLAPHNFIDKPSPGIILNDSFDSFSRFGNWTHLWMNEDGKVTKIFSQEDTINNPFLLVKSSSIQSWSISHKKFIRVKKGDIFHFKVLVKLQGKELSAYAGVAAFDESKDAVSWNYITEKTKSVGEWTTLEKIFTIDDNIAYIQFKLAGRGIGEFRIDDVLFSKKLHHYRQRSLMTRTNVHEYLCHVNYQLTHLACPLQRLLRCTFFHIAPLCS